MDHVLYRLFLSFRAKPEPVFGAGKTTLIWLRVETYGIDSSEHLDDVAVPPKRTPRCVGGRKGEMRLEGFNSSYHNRLRFVA
jgi:hypothetical protein